MITFAFKTRLPEFQVIKGKVDLPYTRENKEMVREAVKSSIDHYLEYPYLATLRFHLRPKLKGLELKTYKFDPTKRHNLHSVRIHDGSHW